MRQLPTTLTGEVFARAFGEHGDAITEVEPAKAYEVAACTAHPVHEHFRVGTFALALEAAPSAAQLTLLGELMYQSHASYSRVGLGQHGQNAHLGSAAARHHGLVGERSPVPGCSAPRRSPGATQLALRG